MTLLLLEALGALLLLIFIVWWTMFSGRRKGELPESVEAEKQAAVRKTGPPADTGEPGRGPGDGSGSR